MFYPSIPTEAVARRRVRHRHGRRQVRVLRCQRKVSIRPQFDGAMSFSDTRAVVRMAEKYGYIDTKGQMIIKAAI